MSLSETENVMPAHHRLASGHQELMDTQLVGLRHKVIHLVVGEVQRFLIFGGPAADAVKIAGARGIKKDCPRNRYAQLSAVAPCPAVPRKSALIAEGHDDSLQIVCAKPGEKVIKVFLPLSALSQSGAELFINFWLPLVAHDLFQCVDNADISFAAV